ncbi:hypothetical protein [Pedobacter ginsengisoli]|uniref:hypothetical protein n=1 Tax=Pedobacter ginsengisoli TaxID=363852 RepID=UPI0012FE3DE5|nr:hypothetical protein [Pedobacter ginsengisoli]
MTTPLYVLYELLIRLTELDPMIGDFYSHKYTDQGAIIRTNNGSLNVHQHILEKQFSNPTKITDADLQQLVNEFKWNT